MWEPVVWSIFNKLKILVFWDFDSSHTAVFWQETVSIMQFYIQAIFATLRIVGACHVIYLWQMENLNFECLVCQMSLQCFLIEVTLALAKSRPLRNTYIFCHALTAYIIRVYEPIFMFMGFKNIYKNIYQYSM